MKTLLLRMAGYHVWAFEQLFQRIEPIPDASYHVNLGAFYKSIHGTLNHLLLTDRIWMGRFTGNLYAFASLDQEVEADRVALIRLMREQAARWTPFIESIPDHTLAGIFDYRNAFGQPMRIPYAGALQHVFNHATHHRGQISTLITHLGFTLPEMDLPDFLKTLPL